MRATPSLSIAFLIAAASAAAQTPPMSTEVPVNSYTTSIQDIRAGGAGIDRFGNFILVWESFGQDGQMAVFLVKTFGLQLYGP